VNSKEQKALIIKQAIHALIGHIHPAKLEPILQAERDAWYASQQLGMNAQIAAQDHVNATVNDLVDSFDDYRLDAIINRLETAFRIKSR